MADIFSTFMKYSGNGIYPFLYLAALLYLLITEKSRRVRNVLVYVSLVLTVLFFFPLFKMVLEKVEEAGTYYRILWLVPMSVVIAYAGVKLIAAHTRIGVVLLCALFVLGGSCVYLNPNVTKAENRYHIPAVVPAICNRIMPVEGQERVWGVFPSELLHFVRQYTSQVQMVYGRDMVLNMYYQPHPIWPLMEGESYPLKELVEECTDYQVQYIILNLSKPMVGVPEEEGMELVDTIGGYGIYRNLAVDLWMKDEDHEEWNGMQQWWEKELGWESPEE